MAKVVKEQDLLKGLKERAEGGREVNWFGLILIFKGPDDLFSLLFFLAGISFTV